MSDYDHLIAAIDAGDDSAIAALADLMEERGDPLAAPLRVVIAGRYRPGTGESGRAWWTRGRRYSSEYRDRVTNKAFRRLAGEEVTDSRSRFFPSRSAAYLALAGALVG